MDRFPTAARCAGHISDAFERYNEAFRELTRETAGLFRERDFPGVQEVAAKRIDLYEDDFVRPTVQDLEAITGEHIREVALWASIKAAYQGRISQCVDRELYKTFFNSLTRRIFGTVGVNPLIEFVNIHASPIEPVKGSPRVRHWGQEDAAALSDAVMAWGAAMLPLGDRERDADTLRRSLARIEREGRIHGLELMEDLFYRNTRCFAVGRLLTDRGTLPLMLAFCHGDSGIALDAVITEPTVVSMLFGYTRSYFHVDLPCVAEAVVYLMALLPHKPVSELYSVLGRAKQGKTERYRELFRHLGQSDDLFVPAPGSRGMVMAVYTLPSHDLVFKVIRDRFAYPKTVLRRQVLSNYELVFRHDRAGRLVDAQEFRRLRFPRHRFSTRVLDELLNECAQSVFLEGEDVVVNHLYIERRLTPLNLFLKDADEEEARRAVVDYGQAIRDLARSNIFPGDLLLKNFGVTRHGRVIFYDYDELILVTRCRFRRMPPPRNEAEELSGEIWFNVAENDVFPEQFSSFLGLPAPLMKIFREHHGELLTAEWWQEMKVALESEEVIDERPYPVPVLEEEHEQESPAPGAQGGGPQPIASQ